MSDDIFQTARLKAKARELPIGELIAAAAAIAAAGQVGQARELYDIWIKANGDDPKIQVALFNNSALATEQSDDVSAEGDLREALARDPNFLPAYINLGSVLERAGAIDGAIAQWREAAGRSVPVTGNAVLYVTTALKQITRVLAEHHQGESAELAARLCLEIDPNQRDAIEQMIALRLSHCMWPVSQPLERLSRNAIVRGIHPLSMAAYTDDPLFQLGVADNYSKTQPHARPKNFSSDRRHAPIDLANRRLRVGYISSDLRDHAIGYLMVELFEVHDRARVEVFAYYCGPDSNSELHHRTSRAVEHWSPINKMSDDEAAAKIAADGIDILVDVNGHTRDARTGVFARRPAPIQVNWLGYPGTMGTPYHHYIIADEAIIPEGAELYYSEKVLRLPCYQPNDRKRKIAEKTPTRAEVGLPDEAFVYCCFNGTHKITRFTFTRWLEILKRVPHGVLWLLDTAEETKKRLRDFAEKNGVSGDRFVFAPKMANPEHLARYRLADIFLDTMPYGAHTTASDALWMGIPVLTAPGLCFASRVCGSLVKAAGLSRGSCMPTPGPGQAAAAAVRYRPVPPGRGLARGTPPDHRPGGRGGGKRAQGAGRPHCPGRAEPRSLTGSSRRSAGPRSSPRRPRPRPPRARTRSSATAATWTRLWPSSARRHGSRTGSGAARRRCTPVTSWPAPPTACRRSATSSPPRPGPPRSPRRWPRPSGPPPRSPRPAWPRSRRGERPRRRPPSRLARQRAHGRVPCPPPAPTPAPPPCAKRASSTSRGSAAWRRSSRCPGRWTTRTRPPRWPGRPRPRWPPRSTRPGAKPPPATSSGPS